MEEKVIKEFPPKTVEVTEEMIRKYLEGISEDNPVFTQGKVFAPPLYATALSIPFTGEVLFDPEISQGVNPMRVVHGEQDSRIFKLIEAGDKVKIVVKYLGREEKETGTIFIIKAEQYNENTGEKYGEGYHIYFVRAEKKKEKKEEKKQEEKPRFDESKKLFSKKFKVAPDQPIKYAEGSGDKFPIHTDPNFAKQMGFPNIILHGMCTMAFATKALIDEYLGGDPRRVKRVRVRFSRVVFPEDELTFTGFESSEKPEIASKRIDILAVNQNNEEVLKNAFAEVD